jgi:hypothetical protein
VVHVFGKIEDDREVAALTRETCSRATREDGRIEGSAYSHCSDYVVFVERNDETDRDVAII